MGIQLLILIVTNAVTGAFSWRRGRKIGRRQIVQASARADGVFNLKDEDADTIGTNLMVQDQRLSEAQATYDEIEAKQKEAKELMEKRDKAAKDAPASTTLSELVKGKGSEKGKKKEKKAA